MRERGLRNILENPDYPKHWRRINRLTQRLVIEADIAPGYRNLKLLAGFGDPVNHLRKLPHNRRLFRIAKIQAIRRANWSRSRARHIACRFGYCMHGAQLGIEIAPT